MKKELIVTLVASFVCLSLFFGCGKKEEKQIEMPEGVLSEDVFAKVLCDFALAESAANINIHNASPQKLDSVYAFDPLKENKVRQGQYDSSITFYISQPQLYKKVYEQALVKLSELQAKRNPVTPDSSLK